jgi:hypothetical protein
MNRTFLTLISLGLMAFTLLIPSAGYAQYARNGVTTYYPSGYGSGGAYPQPVYQNNSTGYAVPTGPSNVLNTAPYGNAGYVNTVPNYNYGYGYYNNLPQVYTPYGRPYYPVPGQVIISPSNGVNNGGYYVNSSGTLSPLPGNGSTTVINGNGSYVETRSVGGW